MEQNSLHVIDYVLISVSFIATLGVGLYFSRRQNSTDNYFKAGGRIPTWAIGLSMFATLVSSITFLAYPGEGYSSNWILLVQGLMVPLVLLASIWFIVPLYRKVIGLSAYEYFEKRFGFLARLYSSLGFVLNIFSGIGTTLFLLALAVSAMTHTNTFMILWVVGIMMILVTLLGGIEGVIWLDTVQGMMLIFGGIACLLVLIFNIDGGVAEILRVAGEHEKIGFGPYDFDFTQLTFIVIAINGVFYAIQKYATDQTIVQRYLTARSDRAAIRASILGVALTVPVWIIFMFIGTSLYVFYHSGRAQLPEGMRADAVFPYFIMNQLPPGVVGLIISALIAAAISTLISELNSLTAICLEDYYKRLKPGRSDRHYLKISRVLVVLAGLVSVLIGTSYLYTGERSVLGIIFVLYAIFSGGVAGMFLLGFFSSRANKQGLLIGIVICILFTAYAVVTSTPFNFGNGSRLILDLGRFNFTHHKLMLGVYSHVIILTVGYGASRFFPRPGVDKRLLFSGWREVIRERKNMKTLSKK